MVLLDDNPHGAPPPAPASTARFGPPTARCACAAAYCPAPAGPVRVRPARARGAIVPLARATDPATRSDLLPYAAHHVYGIFAIKVQSNYLDRRPRPGNQLRFSSPPSASVFSLRLPFSSIRQQYRIDPFVHGTDVDFQALAEPVDPLAGAGVQRHHQPRKSKTNRDHRADRPLHVNSHRRRNPLQTMPSCMLSLINVSCAAVVATSSAGCCASPESTRGAASARAA